MEIIEPRLIVWGSVVAVTLILAVVAFFLVRWARVAPSAGQRFLALAILVAALVLSGFGVTALAGLWNSLSLRLEPGLIARWLPAVLVLILAGGSFSRRGREADQA
jgi:hydrogenase-4 membrane subunit HyfE